MKTLLLLIILSINAFAQSEPINCDSLLFPNYIVYVTFQTMPEPIGGMDSIQSRLVYPQGALENNIEGKVYIRLAIDSCGNQLCTRVIKGLGYGCDEEAMRLVQTAKFFPGSHMGKTRTMIVSIPIVFSLEDKKKE